MRQAQARAWVWRRCGYKYRAPGAMGALSPVQLEPFGALALPTALRRVARRRALPKQAATRPPVVRVRIRGLYCAFGLTESGQTIRLSRGTTDTRQTIHHVSRQTER